VFVFSGENDVSQGCGMLSTGDRGAVGAGLGDSATPAARQSAAWIAVVE
jgi:hypothetical protein